MKMFSEQLPDIAQGGLDAEITDALASALVYLDEFQAGTPEITIKLKLGFQPTKAGPTVKLKYSVDLKTPKQKPAEYTMFLSPEGNLLLDAPNQGRLFERAVSIEQNKPDVVTQFRNIAPQPVVAASPNQQAATVVK